VRVLPERHQLEVELILSSSPADERVLTVPTWVPGAYAFMRYGRDLFKVSAVDEATGKGLSVDRQGWSGFKVKGARGPIRVSYVVGASDTAMGELTSLVDEDYAVLLGTPYLYAREISGPAKVRYELPEGWKLHHPAGAKALSATEFLYADFPELLDTPVVVGHFEVSTRRVHGVDFHTLFVERAVGFSEGAEGLADAFQRVAEETHRVFGDFPFQNYTFVCSTNPTAHWGLEHRSSTMVGFGPHVFIDASKRKDAVRVVAHELFHAWNVCRLKPAPLGKLDWVGGGFPDALWVSEGFTRYYEFLLSVRAGELPAEAFFSNVVNYHRHLAAMPAYLRVTAEDSSRATFLNHNKFPGSINASVDYYDLGMLVAFELDAFLRLAERPTSLDEVFAAFYRAYVGKGDGFTTHDVKAFFEAQCPGAGAIVSRTVERAGELAVAQRLESLGFQLEHQKVRHLGLVLKTNTGPEIANVLDTAPAAQAGLAAGDELVEVGGHSFDLKALKWLVGQGRPFTLRVRRGTRALEKTVAPSDRSEVAKLVWRGTSAQLDRLSHWLGRPALDWKVGQEVPLTAYDNFHGVQTVL
jgi:predicted metalloprotease with PDZ domain